MPAMTRTEAQIICENFNAAHPVGSKIRVKKAVRKQTNNRLG